MSKKEFRKLTKISLSVHRGLSQIAIKALNEMGISNLSIESARTARLRDTKGFLGLFGLGETIEDSPTDLFRITVLREDAKKLVARLVAQLDLRTTGRGSIYAQDVEELSDREFPKLDLPDIDSGTMLGDLTLINGIQSMSASGENISKVALQLGVGVPTVCLGEGTGIRNRLGLLRITITPEKEITYLLVPRFDANGLQNLLVEKGKLNRPGGGFIYQTPIKYGLADQSVKVGYQRSAASIEQIVAAIDDIKKDTSWRKRIFNQLDGILPTETKYTHSEICLVAQLEHCDDYVQAAMDKGAGGATMSYLRHISIDANGKEEVKNYEYVIICIRKESEAAVIESIVKLAEEKQEEDWFIQKIAASSIYANHKSS